MLIVAVNGSPRKRGNTARLLEVGLSEARARNCQTALIHTGEILRDLSIPFCYQCSSPCQGKCSQGNKLGDALDLLRAADGLILGSPVYFGTISGQIKAFWDKTRVLRAEKALLNVPGVAVAVGSSRFGGQENTITALHQMMLVHGMTVLGDGFWEDDCGHHGACAQKPAEEDLLGLQRAKIQVKRLIQVARATSLDVATQVVQP